MTSKHKERRNIVDSEAKKPLTIVQKKRVLELVYEEDFMTSFIDQTEKFRKIRNAEFQRLRIAYIKATKRLAKCIGFTGFDDIEAR